MEKRVLMRITVPFISHRASFDGRQLVEGRDSELIHRYTLALARELQANAEEFTDCEVEAIRLDGGTPSILSATDFDHLMRLIRTSYTVREGAPVSMRTCPADINGANMPFYNRNHLTRYDLEMFSLEPEDFVHLDTLNYREQLPYISYGFLHAAQRKNMGFVLLYGKRTISRWGFRRSILETIRRPVSHVLLEACAGEDAMKPGEAARQLTEAAEILKENGFQEYIPHAWAKAGCEDPVLRGEYEHRDVLGFGLSAMTRLEGAASKNTADLSTYLAYSGEYERITKWAGPASEVP